MRASAQRHPPNELPEVSSLGWNASRETLRDAIPIIVT
jgi:hypothetical protein